MKFFRVYTDIERPGGGSTYFPSTKASAMEDADFDLDDDAGYQAYSDRYDNFTKDGLKYNPANKLSKRNWLGYKVYRGQRNNAAKSHAAGEAAMDRFATPDKDPGMSLADKPDMLQLVNEYDSLATLDTSKMSEEEKAYWIAMKDKVNKEMEILSKKYDDENADLSGNDNANGGTREDNLTPGWWKTFETDSNSVKDYFGNNMANTWKNLGDRDRRILLWDQVGTMLRNASKYRPKLYGAFGNVVDEGQNAGEEKSLLDKTLESSLKAGLDRANTRMKTTMMNALENANAGADEMKMVQRGLDEGWLNRENSARLINMLTKFPKRTLSELKDILTSMASKSYGLSTPFGGVNYTSPNADIGSFFNK